MDRSDLPSVRFQVLATPIHQECYRSNSFPAQIVTGGGRARGFHVVGISRGPRSRVSKSNRTFGGR